MKFDFFHVLGYVGALASLLVGGGQLIKIIRSKKADDISVIDYFVRIFASLLLGVYSTSMSDLVFLVVNFGSAALAATVLVAARLVDKKR